MLTMVKSAHNMMVDGPEFVLGEKLYFKLQEETF